MKNVIAYTVLVLALGCSAYAQIGEEPDHTLLWGQFEAVRMIDGYAIATASEGLAVCEYDGQEHEFVHIDQMFLDEKPVRLRLFGDTLVARTLHDSLILVDVSALPQMTRLGAMHPGTAFDDFVLHDNEIYVSVWFEGVWRYENQGPNGYVFADSTMKPILVTQMHVRSDTLFVLDEYNGLVRYDLNGPGFGTLIDYLWIPFRVSTVYPMDDSWLVSRISSGVYLGEFGYSGSGIVDSLGGWPAAEHILIADTLLALIDYRFVTVLNRHTFDSLGVIEIGDDGIDGDVAFLEGEYKIVLPGALGGLVIHSLQHIGPGQLAYYRPGPISGLALHDGLIFTGGRHNPVDVFSVSDGEPRFAHTIYGSLTDVRALTHNGDTLLVLYQEPARLAMISGCDNPDSVVLEGSITVKSIGGKKLDWIERWSDSSSAILLTGRNAVSLYHLPDSQGIQHAATWTLPGDVDDAIIVGRTLVVAGDKRQLMVYTIDDDYSLTYRSYLPQANQIHEMISRVGQMAYFADDQMVWLNVDDPTRPYIDTVIDMVLPTSRAQLLDQDLYTVGPGGVAHYDWSGAHPVLIDYGGRGGSEIVVDDEMIVTTGGGSVNIYLTATHQDPDQGLPQSFALLQNFPNPFNLSTTIAYDLPKAGQVRLTIFNALGQRVRMLVDGFREAGPHRSHWDGRTAAGQKVASGVYFYRVDADEFVSSRKMVLIK